MSDRLANQHSGPRERAAMKEREQFELLEKRLKETEKLLEHARMKNIRVGDGGGQQFRISGSKTTSNQDLKTQK